MRAVARRNIRVVGLLAVSHCVGEVIERDERVLLFVVDILVTALEMRWHFAIDPRFVVVVGVVAEDEVVEMMVGWMGADEVNEV